MSERASFPGMSLEGEIAFVTGGASGIGRETVLVLAELGADVAVFDWTPGGADAVAGEVQALGRRAIDIEGDMADEQAVVAALERTKDELGDVSIAVPCAGVTGAGGPVFETSADDFDHVMGVNVRGSFLVTREAARQMRPHRRGAIILLSSLDGLQAEHGMFSYCTSKGAILNLMRAASLDLARERIRVNAVCPSVTLTPLLQARLDTLPDGDEVLGSYAYKHPLGRVLTPRDIASAIAYLASPLATGITGAAIPVDAGIGATWDDYADPPWFDRQVRAV
jgi:NAD(P)-dependent dehydrogenase (short-subunit alcohol dehydrogenase family)